MKAMKGILVVVVLAFAGYGAYTIICGEVGKEEAFPDSLRRELEESGMNLGGPGSDTPSGALFTESGELAPLNDISLGEASSKPPGSLAGSSASGSSSVPPMFASDSLPDAQEAAEVSSAKHSPLAEGSFPETTGEPDSVSTQAPFENVPGAMSRSVPSAELEETMPPVEASAAAASYGSSPEPVAGEAPPFSAPAVGGEGTSSPEASSALPFEDHSGNPDAASLDNEIPYAPPAAPPTTASAPRDDFDSIPASESASGPTESEIAGPPGIGGSAPRHEQMARGDSGPSIGGAPSISGQTAGLQGPRIGRKQEEPLPGNPPSATEGSNPEINAKAPSESPPPGMPPLGSLPDTTPAVSPRMAEDSLTGTPNASPPDEPNKGMTSNDPSEAGFASASSNTNSLDAGNWNQFADDSVLAASGDVPLDPLSGNDSVYGSPGPPSEPTVEMPQEQSLAPPEGEMPIPRQASNHQASNRGIPPETSELMNPLEQEAPANPPVASSAGAPQPPPMHFTGGEVRKQVVDFLQAMQELCNSGEHGKALERLSPHYNLAGLNPEERRAITQMLDYLAGVVIYSRQPVLEPAYQVSAGETLKEIAAKYNVTSELLRKINGLPPHGSLSEGQTLKVVRGPFHARVDLDAHELLLTLGERGYYAGRFRIGVGRNQVGLEGEYTVQEKRVNPPFIGPEGRIDADDPNNPLGERWIGLNHEIGIHGTHDPSCIGNSNAKGMICLGDRDAEDVFDILTIGSRVTIVR